jgi:hypothetical protein
LEEDDEHRLENIIPLHKGAIHREWIMRNWKMAKFTIFFYFPNRTDYELLENDKVRELVLLGDLR